MRKSDSSRVPDDVTATALVSLDNDVIATALEISEGDIIEELRACQEPGEGEESDDEISIKEIYDPVVKKSSRSAIESALDDLKYATMFSDESVQMQILILSFERLYENERLKSLKQRDITDFLKPLKRIKRELKRTFSISNKFVGPLRVRDRESPVYFGKLACQ